MADITLRGRITDEDQIELLDPLPENVDRSQEVTVILGEQNAVYETMNDYGDRVLVDEESGTISPVDSLTTDELLHSPLVGLWADRQAEIGDSVAWLHHSRQQEQQRDDPWQGRKLS